MSDVVTKRRSTRYIKQNKRLRKSTKITPWTDEWELESVGRALISVLELGVSETEMSLEQAFEMVAAWKARSHAMEGLPHAVESTYHLAHVYWRDNVDLNSTMSVTELRLSYSSTIVRTINGFADTLQQQRFVASSVSLLCAQLGIPAWIVDIRHEASHNALPTLSVLRLATSTLMEFLKNEYWILTCPNWIASDGDNNEEPTTMTTTTTTTTSKKEEEEKKAIDYLLEYKTCATLFFSASSEESIATQNTAQTTTTKKKASKPVVSTLPIDPFFSDGSSDDDDWVDPILGSVGGTSIGTSWNRFALLEPPKPKSKTKAKTEKKKKKKSTQPTQKKKPGEKYPIDYAKDFVTAVSPQAGFTTAIMFLVWGGIGGSPSGRGVLIPGSITSFPATSKGITKSWQRYSPLLQVLGRVWPGFCSCLLVHLVDFVLSIEETLVENQSLDPGSARKLYFLSAWIRLLLSQQYIATIDPEFVSKTSSKKNGPIELTLSELSYLENLGYPLNALGDRCSQYMDSSDFRNTSHDVLDSIEEILGEKRVSSFGLANVNIPKNEGAVVQGPFPKPWSPSALPTNTNVAPEEHEVPIKPSQHASDGSKMSLDEMEALLVDGESSRTDKAENAKPKDETGLKETEESEDAAPLPASLESDENNLSRNEICSLDDRDQHMQQTDQPRSAWVRCATWEPCSLGILPGYPF
jgi:ribosomal biogenesis protein LAS1